LKYWHKDRIKEYEDKLEVYITSEEAEQFRTKQEKLIHKSRKTEEKGPAERMRESWFTKEVGRMLKKQQEGYPREQMEMNFKENLILKYYNCAKEVIMKENLKSGQK
jgi:hypothetical protein